VSPGTSSSAGPVAFASLARAAADSGRRSARAWLAGLLPRRLAEALLLEARVPAERPLAQFSKAEMARLLESLTATRLPVAGTRGFDHAEVTRGGVPLTEVDPKTLESRVVADLFVAGELLDLDGPIGGYNFSAAFATGALAGRCAAGGAPADSDRATR